MNRSSVESSILVIPKTIVGVFRKSGKYTLVVPDDKKFNFHVLIPKDKRCGAVSGQKVHVLIEKLGAGLPKGRVLRVLGFEGDPQAETLGIILQNEIPFEFPEKVIRQAASVSDYVSAEETAGRKDCRSLLMVTIDGEDTRDFDDAVTIEKKDETFILGVHIADVAHYVKENTPMDREALKRGNSVYLPDRVIPMLPFKLSNGICSLIADKDRLAMSVFMEVSTDGDVLSHSIYESVIQIDKRFTYTKVNNIIEGREDTEPQFAQMFITMAELAGKLEKKRFAKGALDFDIAESRIILDKSGRVAEICAYERNTATKIIEEFMILCNETIAEHFFWSGIPFVYRVHEAPDSEKTAELAEFLRVFGKAVKGGRNSLLHPMELQKILNNAEGTPEERIIKKAILRAMKQARYSHRNDGHFGLSLRHYCHFTSPIRRYADLQIHRFIKKSCTDKIDEEYDRLASRAESVSAQVSKTERTAEAVERAVTKLRKAEYMEGKIGEVYDGVISFIAKHGIYVELPNTVEGMVSLHTMDDDYYIYDGIRFIGERTRKEYRIGQNVKIMVKSASVSDRLIDFIFI